MTPIYTDASIPAYIYIRILYSSHQTVREREISDLEKRVMASFDAYSVNGGYTTFDDSYSSVFSSADAPPYSAETDEVAVDHHANGHDPFGFGSSDQPVGYSGTIPIANGNGSSPFDIGGDAQGIFSSDGPILPPPGDMQEEGFALREWRRLEFSLFVILFCYSFTIFSVDCSNV